MSEWLENLPDDLKSNPTLAKFEDASQLAKSYVELEAFRGQSLRIPGEDASAADQQQFYETVMTRVPGLVRKPSDDDEESVGAFWKSMGRPEDADGYAEIEGMTPDQTEAMRKAALDANLTNTQFKKMAEQLTGKASQEREQMEFNRKQELDKLHLEWGTAKDQKMTNIKHIAAQMGMDETLMADIHNENPAVLRFMDAVVQKIGNEGAQLQNQLDSSTGGAMTPQEAELALAEIFNNSEHPFFNPADPGNAAAKRRVIELQTLASPGASTTLASQRSGYGSVRATDTIF